MYKYLVDYIAVLGKNRPRQYRILGKLLDPLQAASDKAARLSDDLRDWMAAEKVTTRDSLVPLLLIKISIRGILFADSLQIYEHCVGHKYPHIQHIH